MGTVGAIVVGRRRAGAGLSLGRGGGSRSDARYAVRSKSGYTSLCSRLTALMCRVSSSALTSAVTEETSQKRDTQGELSSSPARNGPEYAGLTDVEPSAYIES